MCQTVENYSSLDHAPESLLPPLAWPREGPREWPERGPDRTVVANHQPAPVSPL